MDLNSGCIIMHGGKITKIPITKVVIDATEAMAECQGFKSLKFKNQDGIVFHDTDWTAGVDHEENQNKNEDDKDCNEECHPEDDQAAKTLYFMGECLFNMGEYDLAILDYQKVISNYRRNPQSAAALLRQGMSFEKLTDHETAKIIYTKLAADYPKSREAGVARQRLEGL